MDSAVWALIGAIVGALASLGATWLASRSTHALQAATAERERTELARAFQRQTLLELQEAIHDALRLTTRAHLEDLKAHREGAEWGRSLLSDESNESLRLAKRHVAILTERLADDDLRVQIKRMMSNAGDAILAPSESDARSLMQRCYSSANETIEAVGAELRRQYQNPSNRGLPHWSRSARPLHQHADRYEPHDVRV